MIELNKIIDELNSEIIKLESENNQIKRQISELEEQNELYSEYIQLSLDSISFIDKIVLQKRNSIKGKVEKIITEALKNVYGCEYSVEFAYEIKNNRTSVRMLLNNNGIKRDMEGFGGGVSDIIAFSLKLLVLLSIGKCDKILIADEPGKHMDSDRVKKFFEFVSFVSKKMNIQIIMCSHHLCSKDYADNTYNLRLNNGITESEKL